MTDFAEDRSKPSEPAEMSIDEVRLLVDEGLQQGYLASDHVADALQDVELTPDQIDNIFNIFADNGIDILEGEGVVTADGPEAKAEEEAVPKLDLSVKTIDVHRTNIMKKLDIHDVATLVKFAIKKGLIQVG